MTCGKKTDRKPLPPISMITPNPDEEPEPVKGRVALNGRRIRWNRSAGTIGPEDDE